MITLTAITMPRPQTMNGERRAFTLVEILVSVAVLLILLALAAPAVMMTRASARRMECLNRLKQWGIAYHQYHEQFGSLPDHCYQLFPLLGAPDVKPDRLNAEPAPPDLPVAICPDDDRINRMTDPLFHYTPRGQVNYQINGTIVLPLPEHYTYPTFLGQIGSAVEWRRVRDGLSQTALASEKLVYEVSAAKVSDKHPLRSPWFMSPRWDIRALKGPEDVFRTCEAQASYPGLEHFIGNYNYSFNLYEFSYIHTLPPNHISCVDRESPLDEPRYRIAEAATSGHAGGVNTLFFDGSVRFMSQSIDISVWYALGTPASNDIAGQE